MKRKKTDGHQAVSDQNLIGLSRAIVFLCGAILVFRWFSSFFPQERLWGINHLAYFSTLSGILITFLGLLFFVPSINRIVRNAAQRAFTSFCELTVKRNKYLWFVILSLVSFAMFVALRNRTHFLGDGAWLVTLITDQNPHIGWSEPLEYLVHILAYRLANQFVAITGFGAYEMVSCTAGVIFIFLAFLLADELGENRIRKAFIFFIIATMGGVELFFGYAEHYAFSYIFILAFIVFGIKYLYGKIKLMVPGLFFLLAVLSHFSSLYLLPALVFLYLSGNANLKDKYSKLRLQRYGIIISAVLVIAGVFWYITKSIRATGFLRSPWEIFVPLFQAKPDAPGYTLFSIRHLLDILNEQMLLSPIGGILLLLLLIFVAQRKILKDKIVEFLGIIAIIQLLYSFVLDPILGAAGDWDLFSATALGYTILAIHLFLKFTKDNRRIRYVSSVLVVTSLLSTAPWIVLNADTDKSINRTRILTDLDPKRSKGARSALLAYFEDRGMTEEASREAKRIVQGIPELAFYNLGLEYVSLGKIDSAILAFKRAVEIEKVFAEAYYELGKCYTSIGKPEQATSEYQKALASRPKNQVAAQCYASLGDIYTGKSQFDKAIQMYEKAARGKIDKKEIVYYNLGYCYLATGMMDEAISMLREALESNPDFVLPHMYLGHAYLQKGMKDKAIEEYTIYLSHATDDTEIENIKELISKLNQQQ